MESYWMARLAFRYLNCCQILYSNATDLKLGSSTYFFLLFSFLVFTKCLLILLIWWPALVGFTCRTRSWLEKCAIYSNLFYFWQQCLSELLCLLLFVFVFLFFQPPVKRTETLDSFSRWVPHLAATISCSGVKYGYAASVANSSFHHPTCCLLTVPHCQLDSFFLSFFQCKRFWCVQKNTAER